MIILVMGVSGCGKSTVGSSLADAIGAIFLEGDDFHPAENIAAMRAGQALTDTMRRPWLEAIATAAKQMQPRTVVIACSALKRSYRDLLRERLGTLMLVHLQGSVDEIDARLRSRSGHFMPASLLASQFSTLEVPTPDEGALALPVVWDLSRQVAAIRAWIDSRDTPDLPI